MNSTVEHMGITPGLSDGYCGHCLHLVRLWGAAACAAFDAPLMQEHGTAKRCRECLNHGINMEHCEKS